MSPQVQQRQAEALRMLHDINRALNASLEMRSLLDLILDSAIRLTVAERGFLLMGEESGKLRVAVARQIDRTDIGRPEFKVSRGIIEECCRTAQPVLVENASADRSFSMNASVVINRPMSVACVPLKLRGRVIGVIYLDNRGRAGLFTADEMMVLEMFADNAATAINNARMETKIKELRCGSHDIS
jgi:sigma-B regulation protein RsbU (phosphoserine phosphatase)